jgi:DNA-binding response OmpR family regulator
LQSLADSRNILLQLQSEELEIMMDYDPERLLQIVHNLLSNAIKFTPPGGRVELRAALAPASSPGRHSQDLILTVTDTGEGIPPEELPHIFDRFYQANNLKQAKAGGTGIGLSLTKELVKAMGGDILAESEVGKGSTFTVRLPVSNRAEASEAGSTWPFAWAETKWEDRSGLLEGSTISSGNRPAVLLIEDNPDVVEYLASCLKGNYSLGFAYDGEEGIEKALEIVPDLIVSDVMMPEKDGFEVCEILKSDERTSHIPIVLLTAKAGVESRIAGLRRGADAYLAKPFYEEELLATLDNLLEGRKKLREKYQAAAFHTPPSTSSQAPDPEEAFLQKARAAVLAHLSDSSFSVDDLCRALAMSQPQLHRKLTALTGKNATLFIRSLRLAKARELLLDGGRNVSEAAYEVGFSDPKYFSRVFIQEFGIPPSKL